MGLCARTAAIYPFPNLSVMTTTSLPGLGAIRAAILDAPPRPEGFPLHSLRDAETIQHVHTASHLQSFLSDIRADAQRAQSTPLDLLSFSLVGTEGILRNSNQRVEGRQL